MRERVLDMENTLFEIMKKHIGHDVQISEYGDMENISLECNDCNEVIVDVTLYDITAVLQDDNGMSDSEKAQLFDTIVNDMCEIDGVSETIEYLRKRGLSDAQLRSLKFEV